MVANDVTIVLAYSGVLTIVGSIVAAIVRSRTGKGESRAHAASMLAEGYGSFADDLREDNQRLRTGDENMRKAMLTLTDAVDALIGVVAPTTAQVDAARQANQAAKALL